MKHFITAIFFMITGFVKGQVINIPDPYFKYILTVQYDSNHDGGEIQQSEALAITSLAIHCATIPESQGEPRCISPVDLSGIEQLPNLQHLAINAENITRLNLPNMPALLSLEIFDMPGLTNVDLSGCINLRQFRIGSTIDYLMFNLDSLDLRSCVNLEEVYCQWVPGLSWIFLNGCTHLKTIDISQCPVQNLDFRGLPNLRQISLLENQYLNNIDLSGLTSLKKINFSWLDSVAAVNVTNCSNIDTVLIDATDMPEHIDFSTCLNLKYLSLGAGNGLVSLNLKNGSSLNGLYVNSPQLVNICADEEEISFLRSSLQGHTQLVNISPYCNFYPGGSYNSIEGKTTLYESGECNVTNRSLSHVAVKFTDSLMQSAIQYSDDSGHFKGYATKGRFTLVPYFPYPFFTVTPSSATVSFDTINHLTSTNNFCISPAGIHNDAEITLLPLRNARPGFNAVYALAYSNRGTTTLSGNLSVNFDNSKMNFVAASENVATQSTGQLTWNYSNLQPFESRIINVTFNLLPPPANNNGDTISYLAFISPADHDETAFDNSFILPQIVRGSFDPNDKQCLEGSKLDIAKIGDYLHYQIRFQNEGTDTAFNIVVVDTLSDKLDWNTFEFIGSSHTCNPVLKNNRVEFFFEDINLPYKAINEPASHGWVAFKIKPKPSVVIGDSLNNSAAIYFDFNFPVLTNTATTIVTSSSTPVPVKLEYFSVNQKNNTNVLNWKANCTYGNVLFVIQRSDDGIHFKAIGNINATALRCQLPFNFTDNNPAAGKNYYRLKIIDADGISFYSKTVITGNNKAGIVLTAVVNNTVYLNSNKQQTIQLRVIAADGKELLDQKQILTAGDNNIGLQMKNAAKGVYTLIIYVNEGETVIKRFIK